MKKEEILKKHGWYDMNVASGNYRIPMPYVLNFMQEYADQETKSLRQELEEEKLAHSKTANSYLKAMEKISELEKEVNMYKNSFADKCEECDASVNLRNAQINRLNNKTQSLSARVSDLEKLAKQIKKDYEGDGMECMMARDHVFYEMAVSLLTSPQGENNK